MDDLNNWIRLTKTGASAQRAVQAWWKRLIHLDEGHGIETDFPASAARIHGRRHRSNPGAYGMSDGN